MRPSHAASGSVRTTSPLRSLITVGASSKRILASFYFREAIENDHSTGPDGEKSSQSCFAGA